MLPVALAVGTTVSVERGGRGIRATTAARGVSAGWERYVEAVAGVLGVGDFDAHVESDVPPGAGLGSSAALTVATARALREAFALRLDDRALALAAHRAESVELGVGSGVMDELAAAFGREGHALLIDCRSLDVRPVPLPAGIEVLVVDSGVRHDNAAARGYRDRVAECRRAAAMLGVESLRELGPDAAVDVLPSPLDRRVRHVLDENVRVRRAVAALEEADADAVGAVLRAGHASLRDLYEVSVPEVDGLVALAEEEGALGARLTGGGFGGSIVAVCRRGHAERVGGAVVRRAGPAARVVARVAGWPSS